MNKSNAARAVERACRVIESRETSPPLAELARDAGFSPAHFQKLFVATVGVSPKAYARTLRSRRLAEALRASERVTDAIYDAGYAASSAAYRDSAALGMPPAQLRRGGAGEEIRYASARSTLGPLLVAATSRGVCAVEFAPVAAGLARLKARFPHAHIEAADDELGGWLRQIVAQIDEAVPAASLPLDIRGTAFQTRVWRALQRIPAGSTLSYGELARRVGAPNGARAVARACATNSLAVVVPCHRVVAGDGALTGYRWGVARKRALLAREAAAAEAPPPRRQSQAR